MLSRYHLHPVIASVSSDKSEYFDSFKYDIDGTRNLQVFLEVGLVAMRPSTQRRDIDWNVYVPLSQSCPQHSLYNVMFQDRIQSSFSQVYKE